MTSVLHLNKNRGSGPHDRGWGARAALTLRKTSQAGSSGCLAEGRFVPSSPQRVDPGLVLSMEGPVRDRAATGRSRLGLASVDPTTIALSPPAHMLCSVHDPRLLTTHLYDLQWRGLHL